MHLRFISFLFLSIALLYPETAVSKTLEPVTLQLRWLHQFQFAGYYMAKEKGYYRDAGLDVTILEANPAHPFPVEEVIAGRAQYGVGNSGLINERANGKPVVVLASIFQTSPNIWLMRKDSGISSVIDLIHKRLMMTRNIENAELIALFHDEGIDHRKLDIRDMTFNIDDLINRKVDAYNAYSTNEPYYLTQKGIEYTTINPRKYGIDFYSDCLFTSDDELANHPERVKAFRKASLMGWQYAMRHPDETIDAILAHYSQAKTRDHLKFEASAIHKLMEPELIEIGHMNPARWATIANTYNELGFMRSSEIPKGFIYSPDSKEDNRWLYYTLAGVTLLLLIITTITWVIYRLNCKIKQQSIRDPLTGLFNRRYLDETLPREMARAEREAYPISFVIVDIDYFKHVNDTYGHTAGDYILKRLTTHLSSSVRHNDFICRYGGEEFLIIMPGMPAVQALERMEECRLEIQRATMHFEDHTIQITISAGISSYPEDGTTRDELFKAADRALYYSKSHGRNQITLAKEN